MLEMLVSMLTTGRTLEESHTSMTMIRNNVLSGKLRTLFRLTLMDAKMSIDANFHMDGKSKNIIH
jgi:hypothetical protein